MEVLTRVTHINSCEFLFMYPGSLSAEGPPWNVTPDTRAEKFKTLSDKFDAWNKRKFSLVLLIRTAGKQPLTWTKRVKNFLLFHASNLSVRKFGICLLIYPGSIPTVLLTADCRRVCRMCDGVSASEVSAVPRGSPLQRAAIGAQTAALLTLISRLQDRRC